MNELQIKETNVKAHLDIEKELRLRRNGLLTFTIRVSNGCIVDLVVVDHVNINTYIPITKVIIEEWTITSDSGKRSTFDPVRPTDIQYGSQGGASDYT